MIEYSAQFLKVIKDLKPYLVEFELDETMKPKIYPNNCIVEFSNQQLIIVIFYD